METKGQADVVEALLMLEREEATGTLDFRAEGVHTRIDVDEGIPLFASAGVLGETLGHVLVREQIITNTQFAAVVRKLTDAIVEHDDENVRFAEVIVELGILTQQDLINALATQIEKKILGCIPRGVGEWSFTPAAEIKQVVRHATPIRTLLLDAAPLLPEERVESVLKLAAETFPVTLESAKAISDAYGLEDREIAALAQLDGTHSTQSLADWHELLCALVMGGSVELLSERGAKSPPSATAPVVSPGRRRAVRVKVVADEKPKVEVEAPPARVPSLRPARNDREATLFSEDEFQSGKMLLARGLLAQSHAQLVLACERSPQTPLYRLYEQFVGSRVNGGFEDAASTKALAIQMVKEDAECAFAYHVLGYLALDERNDEAAKRFFTKAFRLDRELLDAGRQARKLESSDGRAAVVEKSPAVARAAPSREAARPKASSPHARVRTLLIVLAVLSLGTIGYVVATRAGVGSDYEEVH